MHVPDPFATTAPVAEGRETFDPCGRARVTHRGFGQESHDEGSHDEVRLGIDMGEEPLLRIEAFFIARREVVCEDVPAMNSLRRESVTTIRTNSPRGAANRRTAAGSSSGLKRTRTRASNRPPGRSTICST